MYSEPVNPFLGIYPTEFSTYFYQKLFTGVFVRSSHCDNYDIKLQILINIKIHEFIVVESHNDISTKSWKTSQTYC